MRFLPLLLVVLILAGAAVVVRGRAGQAPGPDAAPNPTGQPAVVSVVADGKVLPRADATLSFEHTGTVAEILVAEGQTVTAGQPLARLDTRVLALSVSQARVGLQRAEAHYRQVAAGPPPEAVALADAGVTQAQASAAQAQASVTRADLAAAEAQLTEANQTLAAVLDGPGETELTRAQAALEQAQINLQAQRDARSAAKTRGQLALDQSVQALTQAQSRYATAQQNWQFVQETGRNPTNPEINNRPNKVNDTQRQQYYDAYVQAEAALRSAEVGVQQAQVSYDNAREAEVTGVAQAEQTVRDAQARLDQLTAAPENQLVAAAQARVVAAEANLNRLRGPARASQLDTAAAAIAQAEAARAQAAAPPRDVDLEVARVEIAAAQLALERAEFDLAQATLVAPIAGTVAQLDLRVGELAGPSAPALVIADMAGWRVETEDLTELEVVHLAEGDAVSVGFDALPGLQLPGRVQQIKPIGGNRQGEIVYTVVVALERPDPRLRWNMTAVVQAGPAAP